MAYCWQHWRAGRVLVVLDDVQDYEHLRPWLPPPESRFRVLLTTRLTLRSPVQNFEIRVLSEPKALELLGDHQPRGARVQILGFSKKPEIWSGRSAHWLGYLPLGIELVGRYLARRRICRWRSCGSGCRRRSWGPGVVAGGAGDDGGTGGDGGV